jgi:hypothetical protein
MKQFQKIILISSVTLGILGCQPLNDRFGTSRSDYTSAKEEPPLKMPHDSLALSSRYDIPQIAGNPNCLITSTLPPGF